LQIPPSESGILKKKETYIHTYIHKILKHLTQRGATKMTSESEAAFAYHEPSTEIVLNYTGFLLSLNIVNTFLDKLLYCGLIGQLFIGVLWGTPGGTMVRSRDRKSDPADWVSRPDTLDL
jgi:hypothetical protein